MSSLTDVATAIGAVLGGVGGVAGLWAFIDQRRQRVAPPPAVLDNVLILREAARQVVATPRGRKWFEEAALVQAVDELTRLHPLLQRPALISSLTNMRAFWTQVSGYGSLIEGADPSRPQSEVFTFYNNQKAAAAGCIEAADRAIAMLRKP